MQMEEVKRTEGIDDEEQPEGAGGDEDPPSPQDGGNDALNVGKGNQGPQV
jgi:hypothetical protein